MNDKLHEFMEAWASGEILKGCTAPADRHKLKEFVKQYDVLQKKYDELNDYNFLCRDKRYDIAKKLGFAVKALNRYKVCAICTDKGLENLRDVYELKPLTELVDEALAEIESKSDELKGPHIPPIEFLFPGGDLFSIEEYTEELEDRLTLSIELFENIINKKTIHLDKVKDDLKKIKGE